MFTSNQILISQLNKTQLSELLKFRKEINTKYSFFITKLNSIEELKKQLNSYEKNNIELHLVRNKQNESIALIEIRKGKDWDNSDELQFKITSILDHESYELNQFLIEFIKNRQSEIEKVLIIYNDEFAEITKAFSGVTKINSNKYLLTKEDLDLEKCNHWIKEASTVNPDLSICCYNGVPDEKLQEYCDLFNETMEDMPDCDEKGFVPYIADPEILRVKDWTRSIGHYWFAIFTASQEMIAKTNVSLVDPLSYQFMVGVKSKYRKRKIGKWLYGLMYKKLSNLEKFHSIHVDHHPLNKAAINLSLGVGYVFCYNEKKIKLI
jgi:hypothetical protein